MLVPSTAIVIRAGVQDRGEEIDFRARCGPGFGWEKMTSGRPTRPETKTWGTCQRRKESSSIVIDDWVQQLKVSEAKPVAALLLQFAYCLPVSNNLLFFLSGGF